MDLFWYIQETKFPNKNLFNYLLQWTRLINVWLQTWQMPVLLKGLQKIEAPTPLMCLLSEIQVAPFKFKKAELIITK